MADQKISALTGATTPLAGTEVLPIVQGGNTVKVSVANLTAGRAVSGTSLTASAGNVVIGTAANGIDFSANTGTAGMTSELLNWYEEGDWTPVVTAGTGSITSYTAAGKYTRIGRQVTLTWYIVITNNGTGVGYIQVTGAPFAALIANTAAYAYNQSNGESGSGAISGTTIYITNYAGIYPVITGQTINCAITYIV
jgi:hypothetical protein